MRQNEGWEPDFLAWVAARNVELAGFRPIRDRYRQDLRKP